MAILVTEGVGPAQEGRKSTLGVGDGHVAESRAVCDARALVWDPWTVKRHVRVPSTKEPEQSRISFTER